MIERLIPAGDRWVARVRCSHRCEGDFRSGPSGGAGVDDRSALEQRRQSLMDGPWTWLQQVHGASVVVVSAPGEGAGSAADVAVTCAPGAVLSVHTADCAPVVLVGDASVGVAHAGWRGIVAGVVGEAVSRMRDLSDGGWAPDHGVRALVGPLIRPPAYEFGAADLAEVARAAGCEVGAVTRWGTPALDLAAAVTGALRAAGVEQVHDMGLDTAQGDFFSHRVRGDRSRGATAVRLEPR